MAHKTLVGLAAVLLLAACDDGGGTDAGTDAGVGPAIEFTVNSIERTETAGSFSPQFGDRFEVASVTLSAVSEGPLPVAPIAFQLTLTDNTTINASTNVTNSIMDGCASRSVLEGESTTCVVVFELNETDAGARSITWSNGGSLSAVARVPAG